MRLLLGILAILGATFFLYIGETDNIFKIKPNKWYKTMMGVPITLCLVWFNAWALLCMITYFVALQFGYGQNNWLTKLVGDKGAVTICGFLMGVASFPVIGYWAILQGLISGETFLLLDLMEVNEPNVAITRGLAGTICYIL
jgi:hypothetical protein